MRINQICIFLFLSILFFEYSLFAKNTKIVVKIDNELITSYDIKSKIVSTLILAKKDINQKNINDLKRPSLEYLIQNRLKKIELEKYNLKRSDTQINSYLNSISLNDINSLENLFKKNGIDFQAFVNEIDVEFKWKRYIYQKYSKKIEINPIDISQEIVDKIKTEKRIVKYHLSEIEILSSGDEIDNQKISIIENEIKNSGFLNAVIKYSTSTTSSNKGELGWVNSSSLSKEFTKILNKLKIGEISKPIKKQNKIIFLKLNDKKISNISEMNMETFKKELIERKKNELFELYSNSDLSKLRNNKFIEYLK